MSNSDEFVVATGELRVLFLCGFEIAKVVCLHTNICTYALHIRIEQFSRVATGVGNSCRQVESSQRYCIAIGEHERR